MVQEAKFLEHKKMLVIGASRGLGAAMAIEAAARGAWFACQYAVPYLKASAALKRKPHFVTISPPVDLEWLGDLPDVPNGAYTMTKFAMTKAA